MDRRSFVRSSLAAGALTSLPIRMGGSILNSAFAANFDASPIQRLPGAGSSREFNGDDIERTHKILWNVDGYVQSQGGWPTPSEEAPVVIVGGGMAGLYATYLLRKANPLLLETDPVFGGNSKGEQARGSRYSLGAAYIVPPKPRSHIAQLINELDLARDARIESADETTVFMKNQFAKGFWEASTDPQAREHFQRVFVKLQEIHKKFETSENDDWQTPLDRITFLDWLRGNFGQVHPHLLEYFQLYAFSSFAASIDELSAVQMLEFVSAETDRLVAFPGGNAAIADAIYQRLTREVQPDRLRSGCLVLNVRLSGNGATVTYAQPDGKLRAVAAKSVIFAAPKFVAKRVMPDLPPEQIRAMSQIAYRGYVVANVILNKKLEAPCYELYHLQGTVPQPPSTRRPAGDRSFSDLVFGTWAQHDRTNNPVLTVYAAIPFDGGRQFLFHPDAHNKYRNRILESLQPTLAALGIQPSDIAAVRMTRWGHSLPVASRGLIASGVLERACEPVGGRIFFANQDNWASPCFETAVDEAYAAAKQVVRTLKR